MPIKPPLAAEYKHTNVNVSASNPLPEPVEVPTPEPDMSPVLQQTVKVKGCPKCGNAAPAQYGASGMAKCHCGWTGIL